MFFNTEMPFAVDVLALCYCQSLFSGALFYAVILNVAGLERTVKEAALGSHKKTNLNNKINFTTKRKYFQLPCSALLIITFLSEYLVSQNYSGDSEF